MIPTVLASPLLAALGAAATPAPTPTPVPGNQTGLLPPLTSPGAPTPIPQIRDLKPLIDVFPYPLWMVIVAGCIAAVILGVLIWLFVRWIRRRPAPPPPTPREVALSELERLRGDVRSMQPYAFSFAVSDVLRTYIGAAYGLHAPRQTSPEFLASISTYAKFSDADRSLLAGFLEHCDLIKFAHVDANAADSEKLLESAVAFVQGGRP